MKKRVFGKRLDRSRTAKRALFRGLVRAVVIHGKIETTQAKAKAVRPFVENIISLAKEGGLKNRRRVYALLGNDRQTTNEIFNKIAPAFADIEGGFTRIIRLPARRGDKAKMARFEWSKEIVGDKKEVKKGKDKAEKMTKKSETRKNKVNPKTGKSRKS